MFMMQNDMRSMIWQCIKSKKNLERACDYFHKFFSNYSLSSRQNHFIYSGRRTLSGDGYGE